VPSLKTDDLIRALAEDGTARSPSLAGRMAVALVIGGAVATILFALVLGVRPDIASALQTWRFVLKVAFALICCMFALWACTRLARPEMGLRDIGLSVAPALLAAAVGVELLTLSPADWYARAVGTNARVCMVAIPLLVALRPVSSDDRDGEQSAVVWKLEKRTPMSAMRRMFGVSTGPPTTSMVP